MRRLARLLPLLLPLALLGCSSGAGKPTRATPAQTDELHWFRSSAEYRAVTIQTYRAALAAVEKASAGRAPGSWAVSVDADDTLLDNSLYEKELQEKGLGVTDESWTEFVKRRRRTEVPGARTFLTGVRGLGGRIAVVTNTEESLCADVAANLDALGMPYDLLLCRPEGSDGEKEGRWKSIADGTASKDVGPLEILVWVGDNVQDFPDLAQPLRREGETAYSDFGVRFFALPNPIYGSWEKNPPE
ncbi:hypothetical protein FBQ97_19220 [Acidobacteria bacterium ACD]|nr:MAG: hypothetical protein EDX89_01580 [Acidobacteriota bacterium]MCE7958064.1 hypothetical protein [Acidobacteria bacterium ACB2]MDL1951920.1 hypothetical protein [Acidobacteria bacterium ACD]